MIIRHLTFHHFLLYHGDQRLELPTDGGRTLTVVVAPNNAGKTSIIRGLKFWFYGEKGLTENSKPLALMSNRAKAETAVGESLQTWVEVCFTRSGPNGPETQTLRRVIEAKRVSEERWDLRSVALLQVGGGARPQLRPDEGNKYQRMLEAMVPPALFDAFYFKGEPLDGKLLGDVGSIREALGQFLHEEQWKEAEKATKDIRDGLANELDRLTETNKALNRKIKDHQRVQEQVEEQQAALTVEEAKLEKAQADYSAAAKELEKLGDTGAAEELKRRHVQARRASENARNILERTDADIQREIGQSLGLPFLTGAIEPVRKMLAEMEKENILPADITPGFADRVLKKDQCICGKPHDDDSRTHWEAYRKKALAADTGEGLRKLLDWVKPTGPLSIQQRANQTRDALERMLEHRKTSAKALNDAEMELTRSQQEMEKVPIEQIALLGKRLNDLQSEIQSQGRRIRTIADTLRGTEFSAKRLKDEVDELSAAAGIDHDAFNQLNRAKDRADQLLQALNIFGVKMSGLRHRSFFPAGWNVVWVERIEVSR
jgi:DNA sulfur modification protein DndD